ncbi:MAG TPA: HAMP domain-containing sensor histidine kinase [Cyclobacteriaceae bacterium]|nr:HAMP domain-containing sensor histidine kinase [Cyclobacteriaceae bacterium]
MDNLHLHSKEANQLPWWTWVVPILVIHIGSEISALFKYAPGGAFVYLPTCMGIVLINWWGPKRIVPAMYINAIISAHLWDVGPWYLWPIFSIPETLLIYLSWLLFTKQNKGKYWLPNINTLTSFLILGITLPLISELFLLEAVFIATGERSADAFLYTFVRSSLGEFISNFGLTLPILYYVTPMMSRKGLLLGKEIITPELMSVRPKQKIEIIIVYIAILVLSLTIPFSKFWFVYGVLSLYTAIRYGFGLAILTNTYIFFLTYIIPFISFKMIDSPYTYRLEDNVINIYLGTSLLYVFSAITGRVISDVKLVERRVVNQLHQLEVTNKELEITNKELDHFAYSVSHDLSAPLKSILGLVNISKLNTSPEDHQVYFSKIEFSVKKLDSFIHEILDYSRNKRQALVIEPVNIKALCTETIENLSYTEGISDVTIDMSLLQDYFLQTDKTRLKMIINNILTNAIKYQKHLPGNKGQIKIYSTPKTTGLLLHVEDNGEGMKPEIIQKLFVMFFRGTQKSKGSGLGLYIAKEAATKIKSYITVKSVYGEGSVFTIDLKNLTELNS